VMMIMLVPMIIVIPYPLSITLVNILMLYVMTKMSVPMIAAVLKMAVFSLITLFMHS